MEHKEHLTFKKRTENHGTQGTFDIQETNQEPWNAWSTSCQGIYYHVINVASVDLEISLKVVV